MEVKKMSEDYILHFVKEVVDRGPKALLPQNLSDKWLNILLREADSLESEDSGIHPSGLLLSVLNILQYQLNSSEVTIATEALFDNIQKYSLALAAEQVTRATEISIEPPTLDNIFTDRQIKISRKALDEHP
jgi:hypothetical protein